MKIKLIHKIYVFFQGGTKNHFAKKWRKLNPHNQTIARNVFPLQNVVVGNKTYGELNVIHYDSENEKLNIGNYVSIAKNVTFNLGGEHDYQYLSTYPFKALFFKEAQEAKSKGEIVIKDDVWIGRETIINSGVTLGQGSIVGIGSIVTKDVEPYSIVGGAPAKLIKYRFDKEIREKLLKIDFSKITDEFIKEHKELFYTTITVENIDNLIKKFHKI